VFNLVFLAIRRLSTKEKRLSNGEGLVKNSFQYFRLVGGSREFSQLSFA